MTIYHKPKYSASVNMYIDDENEIHTKAYYTFNSTSSINIMNITVRKTQNIEMFKSVNKWSIDWTKNEDNRIVMAATYYHDVFINFDDIDLPEIKSAMKILVKLLGKLIVLSINVTINTPHSGVPRDMIKYIKHIIEESFKCKTIPSIMIN